MDIDDDRIRIIDTITNSQGTGKNGGLNNKGIRLFQPYKSNKKERMKKWQQYLQVFGEIPT